MLLREIMTEKSKVVFCLACFLFAFGRGNFLCAPIVVMKLCEGFIKKALAFYTRARLFCIMNIIKS